MDNHLSSAMQLHCLRPRQFEEALRRLSVVYVPFGLIEWHGRHLPLGNDAMKAHAFLVKCAEQFGGVVYPPVYYPSMLFIPDSEEFHPDEEDWKVVMLTGLFSNLKAMGARIIIGVSGHNILQQTTWINRALAPVVADGAVAGVGLWEISLNASEESNSDHAANWETSNMLFFYPELVDMSELGTGPLAPNMRPPDGIGGLDPREHASAEVGRRNAELAVAAIGRKAQELLESLPENQRTLSIPGICPPHWWCV